MMPSNVVPEEPAWWGKDYNGRALVERDVSRSAAVNPGDPVFQAPRIGSAPSSMKLSPNGEAYIRSWEQGPKGGAGLAPYPSVEKGSDTVGWGHKIQKGEDYSGGMTLDQAEKLYQNDLRAHQRFVQRNVDVPLMQHQFDALTSLAFTAPQAFLPGTGLMKKLNSGDYAGAADEILRYDHGSDGKGGKPVIPGLTRRRKAEWNMFSDGVYSNNR